MEDIQIRQFLHEQDCRFVHAERYDEVFIRQIIEWRDQLNKLIENRNIEGIRSHIDGADLVGIEDMAIELANETRKHYGRS